MEIDQEIRDFFGDYSDAAIQRQAIALAVKWLMKYHEEWEMKAMRIRGSLLRKIREGEIVVYERLAHELEMTAKALATLLPE